MQRPPPSSLTLRLSTGIFKALLLPTGSNSSNGLGMMNVMISIGGRVLADPQVPLNITGYEIPLDISSLQTQKTVYQVTCTTTYQGETSSSPNHIKPYFSASASLLYLADTKGSVVKTDLWTGTLWTWPANGMGGPFQPLIPQGFYVPFDQYLAKNLSIIDQLKADGFNTVGSISLLCCGAKANVFTNSPNPTLR